MSMNKEKLELLRNVMINARGAYNDMRWLYQQQVHDMTNQEKGYALSVLRHRKRVFEKTKKVYAAAMTQALGKEIRIKASLDHF